MRIRSIGTITSGGTPKSSEPLYYGGEILWITPADMGKQQNQKFFKTSSKLITKLGLQKSSAKLISKNSIVYSSRAPIGYINIVRKDFTTNQGCKSVTPLIININFLYWILQCRTKDIILRSSGTTFKEISAMEFGITLLPLPPLAEQKRIVAQIERALKKVEIYAESYNQLQKLDQIFPDKLKKSILQYAMQGKLVEQDPNDESVEVLLEKIRAEKEKLFEEGKIKKKDLEISIVSQGDDNSYYEEVPYEIPKSWEWVRFSTLVEIVRGGSPRPIKDYLTSEVDGINWIKIGDTEKGEKYINNVKEKIKKSGLNKTRFVKKGTFLLTNSMSFGRPYILNVDGAIHDGWLAISNYENSLNRDYLFYILSSNVVYSQFLSLISGAVVKNLNSDKVASILIPLPPLPEQSRIVDKIEKSFAIIDALI